MNGTSEKMTRMWADSEYRARFERALTAASEAAKNMDPRTRAERSIRASRTKSLKRLGSQ